MPSSCPKCGAEITDPDDPYCPQCLLVVNTTTSEKDRSSEKAGEKEFVQEYRRTCRDCGKVWHSLEWRERQLQKEGTCYSCECSLCDMCSPWDSKSKDGAPQNGHRNVRESELDRLRTCPSCHSGNYQEEILSYDRK